MKSKPTAMLIGVLLICQACTTAKLWEDTNPKERVWVAANVITEEGLKKKGVKYEAHTAEWGNGYLIEKSQAEKMKDFHLRMLGTPATVVLDAATTVVVVGAVVLLSDPDGVFDLIKACSTDGKDGHAAHGSHRR